MEKKRGDSCPFPGNFLYISLLALLFMTLILWDRDKNPFISTHESAQNQYATPPTSPACFLHDPINSSVSMEPEMKTNEVNSQPMTIEQREEASENADSPATSYPTQKEEGNKNETASVETEGTTSLVSDPNSSSVSMEPEMKTNEQNSESMTIEQREEASESADISATSYPSEREDGNNNNGTASSVETKVCNYAKGRWVPDSRPPLYAAGCKYMQRRWACRFTNRTDFSYEGYRWQSIDCTMPEFEPSDFLRRMQDKTVAFIGDSLSRQQFNSMMCMLTRGEESPDVEDVADKYGFLQISPNGRIHHRGWAYHFRSTNTTVMHHWSARLCYREPINASDPNTLYAMHLDRQPAFIRENLDKFNVLVLNTVHHWSKQLVNLDKEVMYVNGAPVRNGPLKNIGNAKNFKVNNIVKWLDSELPSHPNLQVFFRTTSPRHFFKGEWNSGGSCDNVVPLTRGSEVLTDESMDKGVAAAVEGTKVKILDITALSDLRDEAHISHYGKKANDCLHWCLPGVPDTWNEILSALV